jgi:hypothetical protein
LDSIYHNNESFDNCRFNQRHHVSDRELFLWCYGFVMVIFELVLAVYMLRYLKKSPKQVSQKNLKQVLKTVIWVKQLECSSSFFWNWMQLLISLFLDEYKHLRIDVFLACCANASSSLQKISPPLSILYAISQQKSFMKCRVHEKWFLFFLFFHQNLMYFSYTYYPNKKLDYSF